MVIALLPARYDSKRFPGKLLSLYEGRSILEHTYRMVEECLDISESFVVAGDEKIANHCASHNIPFLRSTEAHVCGSDRCISAYNQYDLSGEILLNVQADQPLLEPHILTELITQMKVNSEVEIFSLMSQEQCLSKDPNVVKAEVDNYGFAIDFVREYKEGKSFYHHIGVYGFRSSVLATLSVYKPSALEVSRSLEQMRWIEAGHKIKMVAVDHHPKSIDNLDQLQALGS